MVLMVFSGDKNLAGWSFFELKHDASIGKNLCRFSDAVLFFVVRQCPVNICAIVFVPGFGLCAALACDVNGYVHSSKTARWAIPIADVEYPA